MIYLNSKIEGELDSTIKSKIMTISDSIQFNDTLFYIYTSGTTGLPKPAIIKHSKFILASIMCKHIMGMKQNDVLYTAGLPLCHTLGAKIFMECNIYLIKQQFLSSYNFNNTYFSSWNGCFVRQHL